MELSKQGLLGNDKISDLEFCEQCILGKQHRLSFKSSTHKVENLEYLHSNLWGASRVPTHGQNKYFLLIVDDHLKKVWVFLLKTKDESFGKSKHWKL